MERIYKSIFFLESYRQFSAERKRKVIGFIQGFILPRSQRYGQKDKDTFLNIPLKLFLDKEKKSDIGWPGKKCFWCCIKKNIGMNPIFSIFYVTRWSRLEYKTWRLCNWFGYRVSILQMKKENLLERERDTCIKVL